VLDNVTLRMHWHDDLEALRAAATGHASTASTYTASRSCGGTRRPASGFATCSSSE
jgi:hypothetical protein